MITRICLLFLLFSQLAITKSYSQSGAFKADSLLNTLKNAPDDTNKAKTLASLSQYYLKNNPGKNFQYANECLLLSQKLNFKKTIVTAYENLAGYYYYKGDTKTAHEYTLKIIPLINVTHDLRALSNLYLHLATLAVTEPDFSKGIIYSDSALTVANEINDSNLIAKAIGMRGNVYLITSDYPSASKYLLQSLSISERLNNKMQAANCYYKLGTIYYLENTADDKALKYFNLSLSVAREANYQFQVASSLQQIGTFYEGKKDFSKALDYFKQSIEVSKPIDDASIMASCQENIGRVYLQLRKTDSARLFIESALELATKANDLIRVSNAYNAMGEVYFASKDYNNALVFFNKDLVILRKIGQKQNASLSIMGIAKTYDALNNYKLSRDYWREYAGLKDSIFDQETIKKTAEMEAKYSLEKKDKEIVLLTKDKKIQQLEVKKQIFLRNSFIIGVALLLVLLFFVYRSYHNRQLLKLQTLRTKIASDLHDDIGSTLSSISIFSLMARNESKEIVPMLDQIGENCRKMLDSMADIVWTINPENDNFEKIVFRMRSFAFELLRSKNIDFEFNTDDSTTNMKLSMEVRKNLYLIFKEATNNMVKYAEANRATFSLLGSKNGLTMLIHDNGKGFDVSNKKEGNGLRNMKNRAQEMGAKFLIESEPGRGTTIQLLLKTA